jgi:chromosome segregation ATPase
LKNQLKLEKKLRDKDTELSTLHSTRLGIDEKVKYASKKLAQAQQNTESTNSQMQIKASELKALERETDQVKKAFLSFEDQLKQKAEKAGLHFSPSSQKEYTALYIFTFFLIIIKI